MASNIAFKITKDTSARKNTRVGSIQSAVEAAATKESHDYYVNRLTEGYKQQLESMEQSYEDQIRELKSQMNVITENAKTEALRDADAKAAYQIQEANNKLRTEQVLHRQTTAEYEAVLKLASKAEKGKITLETRYRTQIAEQSKRHNEELDKAHREKSTGPYRWTEIKFVKRYKSRVTTGAPKLAAKRSGAKFSELAQAALNSKSTDSWGFEYNGRSLTDMEKTLTQVGDHASAYEIAWIFESYTGRCLV